jgi:type I restriction enzyme S subunit
METLQPKLRFPEFEGTWEFKSLREITSLITKGTTPKTFSENGVNFIKIECLNGHNIDTSKCLFIDEKTHNKELKRSILQENDLLFAIAGATIGKCTTVKKEALPANTNQALAIIRLKEKENKDYIFQILTSECMSKYIKDNISVGAQPNLNLEQINSFSFSYPSHEEQTRIANFLSLVDEKLNLLKEKKSLLEEYKKGIMQKIFNQEIRFKDDKGNDFEEWENFKLGVFAKITTGSSNREDSNLDGEYTFFDRSQDIRSSDRFLFDAEAIIVPGEGQEFIPKYFKGKFDLHQRTYAIMNFGNNDGVFLFYSITHNKNHLNSHAVGSTVKSLRLPMFESMPINLPSLREQTKIANFLSAIDEKIALVSNQIQDTQEYKKGLLQQMFV